MNRKKSEFAYIEISTDGTSWRKGNRGNHPWIQIDEAARHCLNGSAWTVGRPIKVLREMVEEMELKL